MRSRLRRKVTWRRSLDARRSKARGPDRNTSAPATRVCLAAAQPLPPGSAVRLHAPHPSGFAGTAPANPLRHPVATCAPTNAALALNAGDLGDGGPQGEANGRVITPPLILRQHRAFVVGLEPLNEGAPTRRAGESVGILSLERCSKCAALVMYCSDSPSPV